ncbi:MAG: nitroreductase family protein, partial [Anaerolineales bacterium]|nr:nitroreductase family protein [Anaerolineales bacterium]
NPESCSNRDWSSMNISDAIRLKRAVRKFTPEPLPKETTLAILNAGRRAQSSKNTQPWHFIAITDKATLKSLSECGEWASHLAGAALGVALLSEEPTAKFQTMFDLGQAASYMQLAAWELGVGSCLASIYQAEKARQILDFPEDMHLRIAISFGYPQDIQKLSMPPRKGGRFTLSEVVHWQKW